jgi:FkbM family methyltransferase
LIGVIGVSGNGFGAWLSMMVPFFSWGENRPIDARAVRQAFLKSRFFKAPLLGFFGAEPKTDADPRWPIAAIRSKEIHDQDFLVFGAFRDDSQTILDIGSNWGYSAASIWNAGSLCKIISFDPIIGFRDCLENIKKSRPTQFDYRIVGLGDANGELDFLVPVIDGRMLSALTTASKRPHFPSLAHNINAYSDKHLTASQLSFFSFRAPVRKLDDLMKADFPNCRIAAAKHDVEGNESKTLNGMRKILVAHTPMLLIESGVKSNIQIFLGELGYLLMRRHENRLTYCEGTPDAINVFYCHQSKLKEYVANGLIF